MDEKDWKEEFGPSWEGKGERLEDAFEDAWDNAKADVGPGTFVVLGIAFYADNPIRGYNVIIGRGGG